MSMESGAIKQHNISSEEGSIMARLYFPKIVTDKETGIVTDNYPGTMVWGLDNQQTYYYVRRGIATLRRFGIRSALLSTLDSIEYKRDGKTNMELFLAMKRAWYHLKLLPTPERGCLYYTICDVEEFEKDSKEFIRLIGPDVFSGEKYEVVIPKSEHESLLNGVQFKRAVKSLSIRDREFLITGNSKEIIEEKEDWDENNEPQDKALKVKTGTTEIGVLEKETSKVEYPPWNYPITSDDF